ncbi:MAG: hypothetical protein VSS75_013405 [Candidatus Parabeggiatoa sp.]|nr:hypothetical protein [Candidatus Parabeggiatoa sp.]
MVHEIKALETDPLMRMDEGVQGALARHEKLQGCVNILGPIKLCYEKQGNKIEVCLTIEGVNIGCGYVSVDIPSATLGGSVSCVGKAHITVSLDGTCLKYKGEACIWCGFPCKQCCSEVSGTIVCL